MWRIYFLGVLKHNRVFLNYSPIGSIADQFNRFKITFPRFPSKFQGSIRALGDETQMLKKKKKSTEFKKMILAAK